MNWKEYRKITLYHNLFYSGPNDLLKHGKILLSLLLREMVSLELYLYECQCAKNYRSSDFCLACDTLKHKHIHNLQSTFSSSLFEKRQWDSEASSWLLIMVAMLKVILISLSFAWSRQVITYCNCGILPWNLLCQFQLLEKKG